MGGTFPHLDRGAPSHIRRVEQIEATVYTDGNLVYRLNAIRIGIAERLPAFRVIERCHGICRQLNGLLLASNRQFRVPHGKIRSCNRLKTRRRCKGELTGIRGCGAEGNTTVILFSNFKK